MNLNNDHDTANGEHPRRAESTTLTLMLSAESVHVADDSGASATIDDPQTVAAVRAALGEYTLTHRNSSVAAAVSLDEAAHARPRADPEQWVSVRAQPAASTVYRIPPAQAPLDAPFVATLARRRSERMFGPLAAGQLLPLLADIMRVRGVAAAHDDAVLTHRLTPSAGARHPIDLVVWSDTVSDLGSGAWLLDAHTACVHGSFVDPDAWQEVVIRCHDAGAWPADPPAALVLLVADFTSTTARYQAGSTLVWRDAGALASTVHLYLAAAGLATCILGVGGPLSASCAAQLGFQPDHQIGLVGAIAVGGPAS